jgi:hypothetical protein
MRHRQRIEAIASDKYDIGHRPNDLIVVLSNELTPIPVSDSRLSGSSLTPSRSRFPSRRARKAHAGS